MQQLLELYAQLAASQNNNNNTDSEQSSEDGANHSYILSPPSSNDIAEKVYICAAERCALVSGYTTSIIEEEWWITYDFIQSKKMKQIFWIMVEF